MRTRVLILVLVAVVLSGCSYFTKSKRLDLAPFAERTVSLAADIEYGGMSRGGAAHYLRKYRNDPVVVDNTKNWDNVRLLLRGVVAYSIEISTLGASQLNEAERNERFAIFLDRLLRPHLPATPGEVRFTTDDLDAMLADIRVQKEFLDALRSAQPFIDELARLAEMVFDESQDDLEVVAAYLSNKIEQEHAGPVQTYWELRHAQDRLFESLLLVRSLRFGNDPEALESLYANEPELLNQFEDPDHPTQEELTTASLELIERLRFGVDLKELIAPDLELYLNQQRELDTLYGDALIQLKKARVTVMIWARAHRNLSEGVTDPAKIDIFDITKKAVDTVL